MPASIDTLCVNTIRALAMDAVQKAQSGHPGMPMGMADAAYVLWTRFLRHDPADPAWPDRDRFVLSAGHGSMLLYALLHLAGYDLPLAEIEQFRQWDSRTPGHPEHGLTPGVETTTGPLGQGFANAVGMALTERFLAATFNRPAYPLVDHYTYVIAGDGCLMEGISSEAASLAGHLGLGRLIVLYDDNGITIDGKTSIALTEDVAARFRAYGWQTIPIDGHDRAAVEAALHQARADTAHPSLILCKTHIAFGSPHKQDSSAAHGAPLGEEEVRLTKTALGLSDLTPFFVSAEVRAHFDSLRPAWSAARAAWQAHLDQYRSLHPEPAQQFERALAGELPAGWADRLPALRDAGAEATRASSGAILQALAPALPTLIGGSADLASSNETDLKGFGDVQAGSYAGRTIRFGVREHAMGGLLNGMALHGGVRPFGATFLVFADYMRPAIRLAALMGLPVIYVFTHDSIYVGEDGPTHQPIEHLAALRAIPRLTVIRPADANETTIAWKTALLHAHGPTALILSRQKLPILPETRAGCAEGLPRGAYVLADAPAGKTDLILIATGSEVSLALAARARLAEHGLGARVVSMPSWELFEGQTSAYREAVLPPAITRRLAIEAGVAQGWSRYIGLHGSAVTIDGRFGASAPGNIVAARLGFSVEDVIARAMALFR
jgi:transketolase